MDLTDLENLSLNEILKLQSQVSRILVRRFGAHRALVFTDVVGSTNYFQAHGDAAGRQLLLRHAELIEAAAKNYGGTVVDTAGDGAFSAFEDPTSAATALIELFEKLAIQNLDEPHQHQLRLRCGLHFGDVLTDGVVVTGDAVNVSARVSNIANPGDIRVSRAAFDELPTTLRTRCTHFRTDTLKGVAVPIETMVLHWRDAKRYPSSVRIAETGQRHMLALERDLFRFGRLAQFRGEAANDIILGHPNPEVARKISRWHFELRRLPDGFRLRQLSRAGVIVDGNKIREGEHTAISPGSVVKVSEVLTLHFSENRAETALAETYGV